MESSRWQYPGKGNILDIWNTWHHQISFAVSRFDSFYQLRALILKGLRNLWEILKEDYYRLSSRGRKRQGWTAQWILVTLLPHFGVGNGNSLQYSCLENSMGRGAWKATVHGVTESQTRLSDFHFPHLASSYSMDSWTKQLWWPSGLCMALIMSISSQKPIWLWPRQVPDIPATVTYPGLTYECVHAQSCPALQDLMDCSLPSSSVHGILQARILEWIAILFCRGSSLSRDWTWVSCIVGIFFTIWATREAWQMRPHFQRVRSSH